MCVSESHGKALVSKQFLNRFEIVDELSTPLLLKNGHFLLRKKEINRANELFVSFYKSKGSMKISERINKFASRVGVTPKAVRVMELKNRWASCSDHGGLNFHWKCILAPINVLDYIIIHELAHLLHKKHSRHFWNEIDKILPDYRRSINWLRMNGAGMNI